MINTRKILILIIPIMLACSTTVEPYATYPVDTPAAPTKTAMPDPEPASGAVFEPGTWNVTLETRCATVTAAEALHIRASPSEKAAVIGYLHNGEIVSLVDSRGQWWKIDTRTEQGWSKAEFLKESECE